MPLVGAASSNIFYNDKNKLCQSANWSECEVSIHLIFKKKQLQKGINLFCQDI